MKKILYNILSVFVVLFIILGIVGCDNILSKIDSDVSEVNLTLTTDGFGTIYVSDDNPLHVGDTVEITAIADFGYVFAGWESILGDSYIGDTLVSETTVTLSQDCTIKASFVNMTFDLTLKQDGNCDSITLDGETDSTSVSAAFNYGEWIPIEATPVASYSFIQWEVEGSGVSFKNDNLFLNPTEVRLTEENATITAIAALDSYTLTVSSENNLKGTTSPDGTVHVIHGISTNISATAATGYHFVNWTVVSGSASITDTGAASTTVSLTSGNATVKANFAINTYSLAVQSGGNGNVSPSGTQIVNYGAATDISAAAFPGYHFVNWTVPTGTASIDNTGAASTTVALTSGNATVKANFALISYTLTITNNHLCTSSPSSGNYSIDYGVPLNVSVSGTTGGASFKEWTKSSGTGTVVFGDKYSSSTTVTVTGGNATIYPFGNWGMIVSFSSDPPTADKNVSAGGTITFSTNTVDSSNPKYIFSNWVVTAGTASIANPTSTSTSATVSSGDYLGNVRIEAHYTYGW